MRIVITGGAVFLERVSPARFFARGTLTDARGAVRSVRELVLTTSPAARDLGDARVSVASGDLADPAFIERTVTAGTDAIFHLAAVVSGQAEAISTSACASISTRRARLLERCRRLAAPPKFVFASSLAVFGGKLADPVEDDAPLTPQSSYGTQKAIGELLVYDMTRKGFIDGRSLRLPTVTVRPGKPNKAASSFASGDHP
jgi:nucleoside-diphosphate-sugar epimerase